MSFVKNNAGESWPCPVCPVREANVCGALFTEGPHHLPLELGPAWQDFKSGRANETILTSQEQTEFVHVLCEGWACRVLQLADGGRQILRFLLPGDMFSPLSVFVERINSSVQALTPIKMSRFRRDEVRARLAHNPALSDALASACQAEDLGAGELLVNLGRRSAEERVAYLLLHLAKRVRTRCVVRENRYDFPLRRQHIADVTGLTAVHVSRVMVSLRERGLCNLSGGTLEILNMGELERIGTIR